MNLLLNKYVKKSILQVLGNILYYIQVLGNHIYSLLKFKVTNNGGTYKEGDELEKTVDQMVKLSNTEEDEKAKKQPMGEAKKRD